MSLRDFDFLFIPEPQRLHYFGLGKFAFVDILHEFMVENSLGIFSIFSGSEDHGASFHHPVL